MSTIVKLFAGLALVAAVFVFPPGAAQARSWHHHHYSHGWGFGFGFGYPYAYYPPPPVYYGRVCRWERIRYWRYGRWHWRSVRRCY
jgi:hypothetical protein